MLPPASSYRAVITPARDDDWETGSLVAVYVEASTIPVPYSGFMLKTSILPGSLYSDWLADVVINHERLVVPVVFSDVTAEAT